MLKSLLPLATIAVATLHVAPAAARTAALGRCPPAHRRVLVSNPSAVVYLGTGSALERLEKPGGGYEYHRYRFPQIQGCARGSRRRSYALGEPVSSEGSAAGENSEGIRRETLGGAVVAYEEFLEGCHEGDCSASWMIFVRDLRTGRLIRRVPTGAPPAPDPHYVGIGESTKIVVAPSGAVAWIVKAVRGVGFYQVHAVDSGGSRVLATGEGIAPRSLALHGSELSWTQAGVRSTAVLR